MDSAEKKEQRRLKKEKNNNLIAFTTENDIRYRGPLSINHVRTLAWLCILLTQVLSLVGINNFVFETEMLEPGVHQFLSMVASMSLPLFLLASFSYILQNNENCGRIVLFYLAMSMAIPILYYIVFFHFGAGLTETLLMLTGEEGINYVNEMAANALGDSLNCNIFIDMLLFSSFTYFLTAKPGLKAFSDKKIYIFRAFALVPVFYEIAAFIYKLLCLNGKITPTLIAYAFLPTKAPLTFLAFALVLTFEILKKVRYMKQGGTEEGYREFFNTKKNSLMFAKSTAKTFALIGLIDVVSLLICTLILVSGAAIDIDMLLKTGMGKSADLLTLAPFVLLFSYNRRPKIQNYNLIMPLAMLFAIVLIYLEGAYYMITGRF